MADDPPPIGASAASAPIVVDAHRAIVFPNRVREQRCRKGLQKLTALGQRLPDIPYVRLSKIERGEVVARVGELQRIAHALEIDPLELLIDLTEPGFDIERWVEPFQDGRVWSDEEERFAVLLAATLRAERRSDAKLTVAAMERDHGIPAVTLSRLENAYKTLDRWNAATISALCGVFAVADERALRALVMSRYQRGLLNDLVGKIADPQTRVERTCRQNVVLRQMLSPLAQTGIAEPAGPTVTPVPAAMSRARPTVTAKARRREIPVYGAPLEGGLIAFTGTDLTVEAPRTAGPRAFALKVCRATLGAALPASAIVVADPDRAPTPGNLAAVRVGEAFRLVTVTFDRMGASKGYSVNPDLEIDLDQRDPGDVLAVIAALFA